MIEYIVLYWIFFAGMAIHVIDKASQRPEFGLIAKTITFFIVCTLWPVFVAYGIIARITDD